MRMLAYQETLKEKKWPLSLQTSMFDMSKSSLGSCTVHRHPVLFTHSRWMIHMTGLQSDVYCTVHLCDNRRIKKPNRCHLLFYCASYRLNMFRALLCPSSRVRDYDVDYQIGRFVLGLHRVVL